MVTKRGFPVKYSDETREKAVTLYMACGSELQVSELMSIPRETIKEWRKTQWWRDEMRLQLAERDFKMQQNFGVVIEEAADIVRDRLKNGDVVVDNKGNERRRPVGARDAALIAAIFHDKRRDARNQEVKLEETQTTQQILMDLASTFGQFVKKPKTIEGEVVDAEFTELQKELQAGGSDGKQGTQSTTSEANPSTA